MFLIICLSILLWLLILWCKLFNLEESLSLVCFYALLQTLLVIGQKANIMFLQFCNKYLYYFGFPPSRSLTLFYHVYLLGWVASAESLQREWKSELIQYKVNGIEKSFG